MLPPAPTILEDVRRALAEDIGAGDLTAALISPGASARAEVVSREAAVLCGAAWFDAVFRELDAAARVAWRAADGEAIAPDQVVCTVQGPARALLSGERTALNFLQTLSGTATLARCYADAVRGTGVKVLDTRKTLPGLRRAQKYAVSCGGGHNHRMGLYDGILIKENHIRAAGSLTAALRAAQISAPPDSLVEVEVRNLVELDEALHAGAQRILLDNFILPDLNVAVRETGKRALLEVSGGVTLENVRAIAETGVDFISVGDLTKNVRAVDLSMRFL
ncbi:MAG: carboxylating nicotinate-nucleotide diphosphorylase [Gammaproteobacteria bacterium]|nr:MAG: carboxylating nicotinate-nucleotide diphosphorylase [Gammaproteobacteria bacterium]